MLPYPIAAPARAACGADPPGREGRAHVGDAAGQGFPGVLQPPGRGRTPTPATPIAVLWNTEAGTDAARTFP